MQKIIQKNQIKPLICFLPYQRQWLLDQNRFKIGMFARQTGKTLTNAAEILQDCLAHELQGKKTRWLVLSKGERQAREMMEAYFKPLLRAYYALLPKQLFAKPKILKHEVILPSGSHITALPSNADAARGFSANLYLDEFAFHNNSDKIWQALYPIASASEFKIRITSTPAGKNNKFYQLMTENKNSATGGKHNIWSRHVVDIYRAIKEGLPRNIEQMRNGAGDENLWQQEYELSWRDEKYAWLSYDLIMSCEQEDCLQESHSEGNYFFGIDISLKHDLYVIVVLEKIADTVWCRHIETAKNINFATQEALLEKLMHQFRPLRIVIDATGMGAMPYERARQKYGSIVEGIHITHSRKMHLANLLKYRFQNRTIRIPHDSVLRRDLHMPEITYSEAGLPILQTKRNDIGHGDRFWAMAMANEAANDEEFHIAYQGLRHRGNYQQNFNH